VTLLIPQAWLEPLAVGLDEVDDASREFNLKAQIVFSPSRPNWLISRWPSSPGTRLTPGSLRSAGFARGSRVFEGRERGEKFEDRPLRGAKFLSHLSR
jgi:hypothetical protein